ncbi:MAG: hypothetical protein MUE53_06335 [Chitinophagales bacterium]|jgi:spore maturation protein SpmA|nr:hypothetical protein [Chitinophagales bacterium]
MALNYIWALLLIIGFLVGVVKFIATGDGTIFQTLVTGIFDSAKLSFEISLGLAGVMTFWMGIMNIGKDAGLLEIIARWMAPFFRAIYPSIPKGHKSISALSMNFSANLLGLDNAATPLGLQAMQGMQELNEDKETASNAQLMYMALNTAGVTLIPTSVIAMRQTIAAGQGIQNFNGADIFIPTLMVTFFGFLFAFFVVAFIQKINILKLPIIAMVTVAIGMVFGLSRMNSETVANMGSIVGTIGNLTILSMIMVFIFFGFFRRINMYDSFVEGAKGGFSLVMSLAPYMVVMLFAVSVFRNSGALDTMISSVKVLVNALGIDNRFVDVLPIGLMKPLSGSGARGLLADTLKVHGVNTFIGNMASIVQGGTETTFYILAVYFGSVGIKNTKYALAVGLLTDIFGLIVAILIGYLFWG